VYDPLQKSRVFHALAHHPALMGVMERLFGEAALVHPRNIARITFPDAAFFTTPAHQDFPLIQGAPETYTAWMPLVDCPMRVGGLAMLAGSHRFGLLPMRPAFGPGGLEADTEELCRAQGLTWRTQDLEAGDALIFHSHTVHRALHNVSGNQLRLSADFRYQAASQPVVADSLEPHYGRFTWEEIYADWDADDPLKYYWKRFPLTVVARDATVQTPILAPKTAADVP
jgi:ectoine hydroxylase-related dioxygenase (phytanoyl-CoA dioxygenase family)